MFKNLEQYISLKKLGTVAIAGIMMLAVVMLSWYTHPARRARVEPAIPQDTMIMKYDHVIMYEMSGDTIKFDAHGPCKVGPTVVHYTPGYLGIKIGESPLMEYAQDSVRGNTLFTTGIDGKGAAFTRFDHDSTLVAQEYPYLLIFSNGYSQGCKTIQDIIN